MSGGRWRDALDAALDLPDGETRLADLERIAAHADAAGDVRLGLDARFALIETHRFRGERWRLVEPLLHCLATVDRHPALVEPDRVAALVAYQRIAVAASLGSPRVGLDQARTLLDDLADRSGAGASGPVAELRCRLADHLGDDPAAREWLARWRTAGPGDGCAGCTAVRQAELLADWGEWAEAVRLLEPVTADPGDCTEQPEAALATLLLPYLRSGRYDDAGRAHVRAYRRHRRERTAFRYLPAHLLFCALGGHPARGLEILFDQLPRLTGPVDERRAMEFAATGALLCRLAGEAGVGCPGEPVDPGPIRSPERTLGLDHATRLAEAFGLVRVLPSGGGSTLARLGADLLATATDLAGRFDARNGTGHQSGRIAARMAERPVSAVPPPLPTEPAGDPDPTDPRPLDVGPRGVAATGPRPADSASADPDPTGDLPPEGPVPLTVGMIVAAVERRGDRCAVDPDGTVVGRWGAAVIRFERVGTQSEILHARVVATRRLPAQRRAEAYEFVNAWNRDRLLPKAYVHEAPGGELVLAGDVTTDLAVGVAPAQVEVLVEATVSTGAAYADAVAALP